MRLPSEGERVFETYWRILGGPEPEPEYHFDKKRKWRFDFAWPDIHIAVEIDGGVHSGGRHVRGKGFESDLEKLNAATAQGWVVYRFTPGMMEEDPWILDQVLNAILLKRSLAEEPEGFGAVYNV